MYCTLRSATALFTRLKALSASIRRMPSLSSSSKNPRMAWIADSTPAGWPAHSCRAPTASCTLTPVTDITALPMTLRTISPTPTGLSPGHLSIAMPRFASSASSPMGSTYSVARRRATTATALQRDEEASLCPVTILCQRLSSCCETPDPPFVLSAHFFTSSPSRAE